MSILEAALSHFEAGRAVLPTRRNKAPCCADGWDRWFYEPQSEAEVRELFSNGAHGLSILLYPACPFIVLDFDGKHAEQAWQTTGIELSYTARSFTQSGGKHLIYKTPTDKNKFDTLKRAVRLVKAECDCVKDGKPKPCGVDLLLRGYSIEPPTPGYSEDPDFPLEDAVIIQQEIIELALTKQKKDSATNSGERLDTASALRGVGEGERDITLFKLACKLRSAGVPQEIAELLILEAARNCEPPFSESTALEKVQRAYKKYEAKESSEPQADKPTLNAGDHDLERITQAALKVLVDANEPPFIFRHADMLSRIQEADDGAKIIRPLTDKSLRNILAKAADWFVTKKKFVFAELPPKHVAENILADPSPPFSVLTRIVRSPIFAADGTLRTKPGYDTSSKTFYDPADGFDIRVPLKPTDDDVKFARETIQDLLFDFPFTTESERTHAVGLLLLPFARELIDGPTPLHLIEKPSPGTGAGLLTEVLTTVFLGHGAATMTEGRDEDEWRKRITAKLVHHNDIVVIDNVRYRLESSALSAALTANVWEDRWLGKTAMVRAVVRMTWIATGNNPALSNEIARRTVRIRLDSKIDRPWLREGFRHANLREYVAKEREKLAWSTLVLIQYWLANGKTNGTKSLGSFENWSKVIGGVVELAGFEGFLGNLDELYEASDAEGEAWRTLIDKWWFEHGGNEVGVADLYKIVAPAEGDPIDIYLGKDGERSQKIRLGKMLQQVRDRQFSGKRIVKGNKKNGAQLWTLKTVQG
jgi:hypothetical protein